MQTAHRVALGGVQLDEIDSRIYIQGISRGDPKDTITATARAKVGSRVTGQRRESVDVTVNFGLNIKKHDMAAREELLEKVNEWAAAGGSLTTTMKPDRRLRVIAAQFAGGGDPWDWAKTYSIVFRAYDIPYWEQQNAVSVASVKTSSGSVSIIVEGNTDTVADITLENVSGQVINTATVTVGKNSFGFTNLAMAAGERLVIDHGGSHCALRIRIAGSSTRSVLAKRTAASADDLTISPGAQTVSFTAQRACVMTVSCRGRYL